MTFQEIILEKAGIQLNEAFYAEIKTNGVPGIIKKANTNTGKLEDLTFNDLSKLERAEYDAIKSNKANWGKIWFITPSIKMDGSLSKVTSLPKIV
jgi:hypothetical protein